MLILLATSIMGCNTKRQIKYISLDSFNKSMFDWHLGSYWIMEDSATGRIDSFYVKEYRPGQTSESEDKVYEYLQIAILEVNTINPTATQTWFVSLGVTGNPYENTVGFLVNNNVDSSYEIPVYFPCQIQYSNFTFYGKYDVYNNSYFNSLEFYVHINKIQYFAVLINYSSGLLKLFSGPFINNHTWELIRSSIVRS